MDIIRQINSPLILERLITAIIFLFTIYWVCKFLQALKKDIDLGKTLPTLNVDVFKFSKKGIEKRIQEYWEQE